MTPTRHADRRDVLHVDPAQLRDTIRVTIDHELIAQLDNQRAGVSRSAYPETVLTANLRREHPHPADDWTPERSAEQRFARLLRYFETGR